uniref:Leucine-rich repeat-containing protein 31 n=1 Tax=Oryzias sinensis TaxID=183150 RepID=A0A8C7XQL5_9TELE
MSQIRKKRSDRKPLGRFLSWTSERTGIPEDEPDCREENRPSPAPAEGEGDVGWGRVCAFLQKLGRKADSRSLSLSHCDLTATDLLELASLLQSLPQLEEVDVSWNDLIGGSLAAITSHFQLVGGVRTLRLCGCRLDGEDAAALGEALACIPLLEILDLSWNGGVGGGALQNLLGKLQPPLRELHLVACQLTDADSSALGGMVATLPRLCVLDVSCNPQLSEDSNGVGFSHFAAALSKATPLTTLRLQACGLTADSLAALGASLCSLPSLRELDLSCNKHLSGGLSHLTFHLAHVAHLESLDLHLCALTRADLEALIQALPTLTALTQLDLSSNMEVGGVVHPLVSSLPLTQMRRLPLNSCSLSQESFTALTLAVPHLRSVDVSWCKVVGGRLALLLDALQPSVIVELRLSSCRLSADDLHHLAAVCRRGSLSSLRVLDLSYNDSVADDGWSAVFAAGGLASLEDLDLSLRPSASASCSTWLPALIHALPQMPALTRLALQRWTATSQERQRLSHGTKTRALLVDWDSNATDSMFQSSGHDTPEE